ncbi:MAG TPA: hypothetical protein DCZ01_11275 [Elusimicrobia bacterium]|nr:MAG: hypothetical protein A2X40_03420 [Elusimicrobia bacterium GWC2_65_9]OHC65909.1 MAG: hypothetical protein A2040_13070 [Rhodocyclales bacterium GWA2_65_19]HAZ09073.1 hypothetical protein [Elusimicrobiota bacterium]
MKLERLACRRRVALLLDYLDRELPASEHKLLARHRASCRSCASLLASLERTVRILQALKRTYKPPVTARRALAAALRNI